MSDIGQSGSKRAKRGRPKKKPDYDREQNINDLLEQAKSLFEIGYDDRIERPPDAPSITYVAEEMKTSRMRVRKLLVTAGYYSTAMSRKIQELSERGRSIEEIIREVGLGRSAVHSMLPYKKGVYKLVDPTLNAEQCQQFQRRKKACHKLNEHLDEDCCDSYLWEAIKSFEAYHFIAQDKRCIKYAVDCDSICFGGERITRREIMDAFKKAKHIQNVEGCVCDAARICCHGAQELYTVFLRIGVCKKSSSEF